MSQGAAIGIDLGSTFSRVAVWQGDTVTIIPNSDGNWKTPTCVSYRDQGQVVGELALARAMLHSTSTITNVMRWIGRKFNDPALQADILANRVVRGASPDDYVAITVESDGEMRAVSPIEVVSMILGELKHAAEASLGMPVTDAVIAIPSSFHHAQREAVREAAEMAGIHVLRILSAPTAAACTQAIESSQAQSTKYLGLVVDMGSATLDVALVQIENGIAEVTAVAGETHLGGDDVDARLEAHVVAMLEATHAGIAHNTRAMRKLRVACERAKRTLSSTASATLEIESLVGDVDFRTTITRTEVERLCTDVVVRVVACVESTLRDATTTQVDNVMLLGGSRHVPQIRTRLLQLFPGKIKDTSDDVHDFVVARGAAAHAAILTGRDSPSLHDVLVIDATSFPLGLEIAGGDMAIVIPRGSSTPTKRTVDVTTTTDNQVQVLLQVFEGDAARAFNNSFLGKLRLDGIPYMPAGMPRIQVTFEVDANSLVQVSAVETTSQTQRAIVITHVQGRPTTDTSAQVVFRDANGV
ncbi:Aste57867_8101 [Aphanomyces stellatus]|uniref:Aste57867_8101 protein n=1 Tax=Aphanomyces stellatus TaxID=120398 RepID=A0A485KJE9_9STRA|nr:hypothetical protein As57867_008071 [Aphanomyces stellatus]VFT84990.1 Aste57867_8101 [Aphanomyces stellatus]